MSLLIALVKGFAGKPSHPPLTDVSVGAYTVGVAMLVAGAAGVEEAMAKRALLAISGGLIVAIPAALTGLLDYFDLPNRTAARTLATYHLFVMLRRRPCLPAPGRRSARAISTARSRRSA